MAFSASLPLLAPSLPCLRLERAPANPKPKPTQPNLLFFPSNCPLILLFPFSAKSLCLSLLSIYSSAPGPLPPPLAEPVSQRPAPNRGRMIWDWLGRWPL